VDIWGHQKQWNVLKAEQNLLESKEEERREEGEKKCGLFFAWTGQFLKAWRANHSTSQAEV